MSVEFRGEWVRYWVEDEFGEVFATSWFRLSEEELAWIRAIRASGLAGK